MATQQVSPPPSTAPVLSEGPAAAPWLTAGAVVVALAAIGWAQGHLSAYYLRVLNVAAIYVVAAVGYNLINGVTGQFSLGPNAFMAIGGYTSTLLMLPVARKETVWFIEPLIWPFSAFSLPETLQAIAARLLPGWAGLESAAVGIAFAVSLVVGGLMAALAALVVGVPTLRLRGDYLAIATFGFGEIVFVLANNLLPVTNGALGIRDIPQYASLWWTGGTAIVTLMVIKNLVNSNYGRALRAIREDDVAAEAMGVPVFTHKLLAFVVSAFFAGVAGALLGALLTTISPTLYTFMMTFNLLIIIVLGGLGSTTGAAVTAVIYAVLQEALRSVEAPMRLAGLLIPGVPGMRMVVFSALLVAVMLFYRRGLFGRSELSWTSLWQLGHRLAGGRRLPGLATTAAGERARMRGGRR